MSKSNTLPHQTKQPFAHRFDAGHAHDTLSVVDSIGLMTERTKGILALLFSHFEGEARLDDRHILAALNAAISEIDDIDSTLRIHLHAVREGGAA